jgi:hypothetical protein
VTTARKRESIKHGNESDRYSHSDYRASSDVGMPTQQEALIEELLEKQSRLNRLESMTRNIAVNHELKKKCSAAQSTAPSASLFAQR